MLDPHLSGLTISFVGHILSLQLPIKAVQAQM